MMLTLYTQGQKLITLWSMPAPAAKQGQHKAGRPPKSGRQMIEDAAVAIKLAATPSANPAAEALRLGPCLIGKGFGSRGQGGRPRKQLTGAVGPGGARQQFAAAEYRITSTAASGQPPPNCPRLEWSHRCHNPRCVEPRHGLWEDWHTNRARDPCAVPGAGACPHDPVCVRWPGARVAQKLRNKLMRNKPSWFLGDQ